MIDRKWPVIVVPGDEPRQISGSPALKRLEEFGDVIVFLTRPQSIEEQIERVQSADVVINSRGQVKWYADVLDQLPRLKMITVCGIGTDSIDLETARERGIVVSNIPGKTAPIVAEHAFALMLATARRLAYMTSCMKAGQWSRMQLTSLIGKTIGVIGTGNIGREMIRLCNAFGMRVIAWTFHPQEETAAKLGFEYIDLDRLLAESDVISVHVKLTEDSRQLIGREQLARMKPGSLLINTARGPIVDSDALVETLQSGRLAGAGLDVYDLEPLPDDHPLLKCEQVVLTPHNADQTPEGIELLNEGCVDNVIAFLRGQARNVVT